MVSYEPLENAHGLQAGNTRNILVH